MRIIKRGNPPRPTDWWFQVHHFCTLCRPATEFVIEPTDKRIDAGLLNEPGAYMLLPDGIRTHCPVCGSVVITKAPEES